MLQRQLFRLGGAVILSGLLTCAQAVELGEPLVRSHVGQPLSADVELTGLAGETASVQAALADPDVYRVASIAMHPALSSLNITIVRRDGKRYLRLASPKTVESENVHLFFVLTENGRQSVRGTTLWFTPDPNPAPAPAVIPATVAAPAIAATPRPAVAAPAPQPVACAPRFSSAQLGACASLDSRNAALSARIVELEEKVKVLTAATHAAAEPPAQVKPAPVNAMPAKLVPVQPAKPAGETPWLFIGIASALAVASIGVLVFVLLRKRKVAKVKTAPSVKPKPGLIANLRDRVLSHKKVAQPPINAEAAAAE